jgi:peptide/nickel transport system substrate-binding protein
MMRGMPCTALLLAGAMFWGTASCGGIIPRDPNVLVTTLPADPSTLNPIVASDATSSSVTRWIFESLLERDNATLKLIPKLARRWAVSPDHLVYTFWLRPDVRWHDGAPLTADDVVFTFERIRDPAVDAAPLRNYFRDVKAIQKLDAHAVRFVYARPYFKALEIIGGATIIPKHIYGDGADFNSHPANRSPVGCGPYRFVEWKSGRHVVLLRNESYWGPTPAIAGLTFKVVPDAAVRFQLLKKEALDTDAMSTIQWMRETGGPRFAQAFTKHRFYLPNYSFIGWNLRSPLFADRRVRQAMTMLVNRQAILEKILLGQGEVVASGFYRFGEQYDPAIVPWPYDPQRARELLAEAGWADTDGDGILDREGRPFRFSLLIAAGSTFGRSLGLFLREELSKVGIEMEIRQLEWATMLKLLSGRTFDAALLAWSLPLTQDPYQGWHSSQAEQGSNFVGFQDARADAIIERARQEFDEEKRNRMYFELQGIIHEEQPYTFLFTLPSLVAVARRYERVVDYRMGLDWLEWKVGPWPVLIEW